MLREKRQDSMPFPLDYVYNISTSTFVCPNNTSLDKLYS